jgi:subtilisin family serine protease
MQFRYWRPVAIVFAVLAVAGCDPAMESDGGSAGGLLESQTKVAPGITADVNAGRSREAIVVFADEPVSLRRSAFHATLSSTDFPAYLQDVKTALDGAKSALLGAAGSGVREIKHYDNLPVMHLRIDSPQALAALQAQDDVLLVAEDMPMQAFGTPANLSLVGEPTAASSGYLGAGATVAVLDTGTDYTRAPFGCKSPGEGCPVIVAKDIAADDGALDTGDFHGTNVAGVVLSVAPSAKIIALDVFDGDWAYASTLLSAIDWCVQNKTKYNIVAINMSLGGGMAKSPCATDPFATAIATAKSAGILTAIASGNDASSTGIAIPACAPAAVSVGAVYHANVGKLATSLCTDSTTTADRVACFSNSASFLTMLAPGVGITAAGITMSGTSQATPHVAGAIALLAAAHPTATIDGILKSLTASSVMVTDARNNVVKPRLDLTTALAIAPAPAPQGTVSINSGARYSNKATVSVGVPTTTGTATQVCVSTTATCTAWQAFANPVAFTLSGSDGTKTVYVSWKNSDGIASTTPASASIILDTAAPSNGVVTAKLASNAATLSWLGFADVTSGLASYRVVSAIGSAPADCAHGTLLYSGRSTTFKANDSTWGTAFRVCAVDNAGNVSSGALASIKVTSK